MTSNLANTFQVLKKASDKQWSGCLVVYSPKDKSVNWQLYLNNGDLQYATSATGRSERLRYLWQQFQPNLHPPELSDRDSEYQQLCSYFTQHNLPESELKELLLNFSQEALVQVLSLEQTEVELISEPLISNSITNFSWMELATRAKQFILDWKEACNYCDSPFSRVYLDNQKTFSFYKLWKQIAKNSEENQLTNFGKISSIIELLVQKKSLYQLAWQLEVNPVNLVKLLQPFIKEKIIEILPWQEVQSKSATKANPVKVDSSPCKSAVKPEPHLTTPQPAEATNIQQRPLVACIDDSNTVQKQVKMILESVGYEVLGITESANALRGLSRQQPVLILMDINMPDINGYDLCSMLRRSQKFQEIPIVMLTGRDGIIDRMRAKFVGATNYLTKPFQPDRLIELVKELSVPVTSA